MITIKGESPVTVTAVTQTGHASIVTGMRIMFSGPAVQTVGNIGSWSWTNFVEDSQGNSVSTYEQFTTDQDGNITGDGPFAFKPVVTFNNLTFRKQ